MTQQRVSRLTMRHKDLHFLHFLLAGSEAPPSCAAYIFSGGAAGPLLCGCVGGKSQTPTPYFNKSSAAQSYAINPTRAAFGSWWHPSSGGYKQVILRERCALLFSAEPPKNLFIGMHNPIAIHVTPPPSMTCKYG